MRAGSRLPWVTLFCAVLSLSFTLLMAWKLDGAGAFTQNNVLFKDDSRSGLLTFAGGQPAFNTLRHPNIHVLLGLPIQVTADLLARASARDPDRLRHLLALLVTPAAGAVFVWAMGIALGSLEIDPITSVLLMCLSLTSFSHLLFSSVPTHFALSGLMVAVFFCLVARAQPLTWTGWLLWMGVGFIATGVSSFNLASWTLFYVGSLARAGGSKRAVTARAAVGAATVVLATLLTNLFHGVASGGDGSVLRSVPVETTRYLRQDVMRRVGQWPDALVMTLVAGDVTTVPVPRAPWQRRGFVLQVIPTPPRAIWVGISLSFVVIAVVGMLGHLRHSPTVNMGVLALGQVLLCVVFLLLWGDDSLFLYSQHWTAPLLVMVAGVGFLRGRPLHAANIGLGVLVVVTMARSAVAWGQIFDALGAVS